MNIVIDMCIFQLQQQRPAGISRFWIDFIPELKKGLQGHNITLLQRGMSPIPEGIRDTNICYLPWYAMGPSNRLDADDSILSDACENLHADVFMSTYYTRATGVLNVLRIHDMIPELFHWDLTQPEWMSKRRAIEAADAFVCTSLCTANDLVRIYHSQPDTVRVSYTAAARHFHPSTLEEVNAFREKYKISKPYFLMVGNHSHYKNGVNAVKAYELSGNLQSRYELVIVGSEVRYVGVSKRVVQIGWLLDNELCAAYTGAEALVYPSAYEGFGLPVLEAMRCGCPSIIGNVASLPEVAGDTAIYIDPNDADSIQEGMLNVVHVPELRDKVLARAQTFSWEKVVDVYEKVLEGEWNVQDKRNSVSVLR